MSVYVYAITSTSHPLRLDDVKGVGSPPAEIRVVRGDSLCAVVSDSPEDLSISRDDLQTHLEAGRRLWSDGPILPLGFGFVAEDENAVRAVLEGQAADLSQRLEELTGRGEFNVKGVLEEEAVLRSVLEEDDRVRELNERTREGGGTYEERVTLGQLVAAALQRRQEVLAGEVVSGLRPLAQAEHVAPPSNQYFISASFLVDEERFDEFARAAQELDERYGEGVELRLRGPLPPYSFV
ncbi:GvpL/GvpF family gas vesicle protein [Streptomyces sp. enrichment culture]|uniref:GvpL/GvpF family gas vesicle protein n=1 Tax=Streptomyces sp. enrichment culture TaxID=1795815 RepID=UPI003F56F367